MLLSFSRLFFCQWKSGKIVSLEGRRCRGEKSQNIYLLSSFALPPSLRLSLQGGRGKEEWGRLKKTFFIPLLLLLLLLLQS